MATSIMEERKWPQPWGSPYRRLQKPGKAGQIPPAILSAWHTVSISAKEESCTCTNTVWTHHIVSRVRPVAISQTGHIPTSFKSTPHASRHGSALINTQIPHLLNSLRIYLCEDRGQMLITCTLLKRPAGRYRNLYTIFVSLWPLERSTSGQSYCKQKKYT